MLFNKKKYDVIFYYPQHFNRNKLGTNSFFDPFLSICEEYNISHILIEEPDFKTTIQRNKSAFKFDFYYLFIIFNRKVVPKFFFKNFEKREQWIGRVLNLLTFGKFNSNTVITISNSMGGFWRGYNPKARIIDYQHGIVNSNQPGFFNNGKAPIHISENSKEVAVWGKGFQNIFMQDKEYYESKVHVLGYTLLRKNEQKISNQSRKIIFSLQFMPDFGANLNQEMFIELKRVLGDLNSLNNEIKPQVVLRNHPRHNNAVDLNCILEEFDFVKLMSENEELNSTEYLLHVTFYSTTAFEMAMNGIPSYFLITENIIQGKIDFLVGYGYPIRQNKSLKELWNLYYYDKELWNKDSILVENWFTSYFEPLNKEILLNIMGVDKT